MSLWRVSLFADKFFFPDISSLTKFGGALEQPISSAAQRMEPATRRIGFSPRAIWLAKNFSSRMSEFGLWGALFCPQCRSVTLPKARAYGLGQDRSFHRRSPRDSMAHDLFVGASASAGALFATVTASAYVLSLHDCNAA